MDRFPRMAHLLPMALLTVIVATALLLPTAANAQSDRSHHPYAPGRSDGQTTAHKRTLGKLADSKPVTIATAVAKRFWGAVPCGGQIAVLADVPLPVGLEPTTDGWVTFNSSLGQNNLLAPADTYTRCTISLARWQWPTRTSMEDDWNMFCLTVVHEMGHLLGHPHSLIPGSVMAPVFIDEANVPEICRATRLPDKAFVSHVRRQSAG
jgi:Matrixin